MKKYSDLKSVEGHKNYYRSEKSGIIYYKDALIGKFSTKEITIQRAKKAVDIKRQQVLENKTIVQANRKYKKITNPMIKDIWDEILKDKTEIMSKGTMMTYNTSWKLMKDFFGDKFVFDLNDKTLSDFKYWYIKNHKDRLVERTIIHLKLLINYSFENNHLKEMPKMKVLDDLVEFVDIKSNRKPHERVYSFKEIEEIIKNSKKSSSQEYINVRTNLIMSLAINTGMRKNEILRLKWAHIDYKDSWINIVSTKNSNWRKFPLTGDLRSLFIEQEKFSKNISEFIFPMPSEPTRPISPQILDKSWNAVKKLSGIKGVAKFHDLRRTCVTRLLDDGFTSDQVSKMLGHSIKEIHQTYYKMTNKFKDEILEKLEKLNIKQGEVDMKKSST